MEHKIKLVNNLKYFHRAIWLQSHVQFIINLISYRHGRQNGKHSIGSLFFISQLCNSMVLLLGHQQEISLKILGTKLGLIFQKDVA